MMSQKSDSSFLCEGDSTQGKGYCPTCFRIYDQREKHWTSYSVNSILFFIENVWVQPIYQDVVKRKLQNYFIESGGKLKTIPRPTINVCCDCALFFKKKTRSCCVDDGDGMAFYTPLVSPKKHHDLQVIRRNAKHPMHVCIEYLISGGCTFRPSSSVMVHAITSLLHDFPNNPIYETHDKYLLKLMSSVRTYATLFSMSVFDIEEFICVLRWLWCGSQRILLDIELARQLRKYMGKYPGHDDWWKRHLPVTACRFCGPNPFVRPKTISSVEGATIVDHHNNSFATVMYTGQKTNQDLQEWIFNNLETIEKLMKKPVDHVSVFCSHCCKISVISHVYHFSLRSLMNVPKLDEDTTEDPTSDVNQMYSYYQEIIQTVESSKKE